MIISCDVDGGASFVNKMWLDFTGTTFSEELGDGLSHAFHPDYREPVMQVYWDAFQERRPLSLEFPIRRHDGEYCWVQARGVPRFLDDRTFCGYIACFVDMDGRRLLLNLQADLTQSKVVPQPVLNTGS
jgi:PAS domain S-box-containing protein